MGEWMARAGRTLLDDGDAVVRVRLHWRRVWGRRFNQAAALARVVAADAGVPLLIAVLKRVRATSQQIGLSRSARAVNVQGAFTVTGVGQAPLHGKRLLPVADALTS